MAVKKRDVLRRTTYEAMKAMIVTGQLAPGARILEEELAAKLKVSRTPIREAVNKLERDGLVAQHATQGYAVKEFDVTMFRESFEVRELLEGQATELATAHLTTGDKKKLNLMIDECERLANLADRTQRDKFQELHIGMEIHRTIAALSGNETLSSMLNSILDKCQHYVWMELIWLDDWKEAREEHAAIVAAMCAGDAKLAGDIARRHIRESRNAILELLQAKSDLQNFIAKAS